MRIRRPDAPPRTAVLVTMCAGMLGAGAALLLPGTLAVITQVFPDPAGRARAIGIWAAVSSLALPAGPLLGGLLVSAWGWRAVFLLNLPVVAVAALATAALVPARLGIAAAATDGKPSATSNIATVLRAPGFLPSLLVAAAMNAVGVGTVFVATQYLQVVVGYGPIRAGAALLPLFTPLAVLAPVGGRLTGRHGPYPVAALGLVVGAAGLLLLIGAEPARGYWSVAPGLATLGIGMALLTPVVVAATVGSLPDDRAGVASGANNAARQLGGVVGVTAFGTITGSAHLAAHFVPGWHQICVVGAALWLAATALCAGTSRRTGVRRRRDGTEAPQTTRM